MAGFKFRLEMVLQQRRLVEDERQRDLAKLLRQRMILHDQLRAMQQNIRVSKAALSDGLVGVVDMDRVATFARYSGQVAARAQGLVMRLAELEKQVKAAQERLLEAVRARRALELLRERQWLAWQQQEERREVARADEMTVQRYARVLAETGV